MYLQFQFEHQVDKKAFFTILEDSHFLQSVKMDVDGNLSLLRNTAQYDAILWLVYVLYLVIYSYLKA